MKIGNLVRFRTAYDVGTASSYWGLVVELGNPYWDGTSLTVAHAHVQWPDDKATWETTDQLEILVTT